MTVNRFREALRAEPFQPFMIRLLDGRTFRVRHPEFVAQDPSGRAFALFDAEKFRVIDLLHVQELEWDLPQDSTEPLAEAA